MDEILIIEERAEIVETLFHDMDYLYIVKDRIQKRLGDDYDAMLLIDEFLANLKDDILERLYEAE